MGINTGSHTVHSKLGASSYDRWGNCPGSVALSEGVEKTTSIYAEEGTLAHDIAAFKLSGVSGLIPGENVTDEMLGAVQVYVDHVNALRSAKPSFEAIEQKLSLEAYHPALFGTADYVAYYSDTKTLHVVDYKHGAGIPVQVGNSHQLMYYGLGALHMNKFPIERIVLTIVQPRCYHPDGPIRSWETDPMAMLDFAAQLIDDALATEKPNAPLHAGDHCRFCPAQPNCPEMERKALSIASDAFTNVEKYDPSKLSATLVAIPQIEAWCKAVREFAYQQASLGNVPPGFKLVDKRANRKWVEDIENAGIYKIANETRLSVDAFYDSKLKSPAQVEKMLSKEDRKIIADFTIKESSGKSLVSANDDRPAVKGAIESMFNEEKEA